MPLFWVSALLSLLPSSIFINLIYSLILWEGRQIESKTQPFCSCVSSWCYVKCKRTIFIAVHLGCEGRTEVRLLVRNKISNKPDFTVMQGVFTKSQAFSCLSLVVLGVREEVGKQRSCLGGEDRSQTFLFLAPKSYKIVWFIQAHQDLINNLPPIHKHRLKFSDYHKRTAK